MRKFTFFFAALLIALGVQAQGGSTVEERGAAKGYYPFAAEVTEMEQITSLNQLTDGMEIMIKHSHEGTDQDDHEGSYLTIYSLPTYGAAHIVFMQEKPVEVGVWTTNTVNAQDGTFKLQSAHGVITNSSCYLGQLEWKSTANTYLLTTADANYVGVYKFVPATDGSGRWNIQCTNNTSKTYLSVTADSKGDPTISEAYSIDKNCYFEIYKVTGKSTEQVKYVENAQVRLIGPSGNIVTTTHSGWNDFYEFVMYSGSAQNSVNYGVSISNVLYHERENLITASIKYAFPISGDVAKIPVHLCPMGNENFRISIVDGNLKVVEKPADGWVKDKNNQWYIFPRYDNQDFTYAIKNVGTGQYINFTEGSRDITLSENSTYFTLGANTAGTYLNFEFKFSSIYTYCLYGSNVDYVNSYNASNSIPAYKVHTFDKSTTNSGKNFLVSPVSSTELDGVPAIGFTRYFHEDAYFWDGGEIADENVPDAVKANRASSSHEEYNAGVHKVFSAETGITVTQTGNVTAQFDFISGMNTLQILGVDIVKRDDARTVVSFDYHLGKAGTPSQNNLYVLENVEAEDYYIRYWVCNRTDLDGWEGHNLKNVRGKIEVKGANYDYTPIDALENGQFPVNTTWYRMRLQDGLGKYISAHPDYMDTDNYLKLSNNTPPSDYAGLWAIVGNETDGYKFYNRAWGPEYAMKTTGENGDARTFMAPANEATSYDIVRDLDAEDISARYKYYVKVHGTDHNYLNDHANNGYLSTWNTAEAGTNVDGSGSVMTFETVNMDGWDERTETVEKELKGLWMPWIAHPTISEKYSELSNAEGESFVTWVLNRNEISELLDGKVFKFVNKADDNDRQGRVLGVDADEKIAGLVDEYTGAVDDLIQMVSNGDGTYKLLHIGSNKYFQKPRVATTTGNAADAASYSYKVYDDETNALCFVSEGEMMHLGNWGYGYTIVDYNEISSGASRWDVIYDVDAQNLANVFDRAMAEYARVTADDYKEDYPGFASTQSIENLRDRIADALNSNEVEATINTLKSAIIKLWSPGIFTIKYEEAGKAYYLHDDPLVKGSKNQRKLTEREGNDIKHLFYYTPENYLIGYASGFGFEYACCNTGTVGKHNTFTFELGEKVGQTLIKGGQGTSVVGWFDGYLTAKVNANSVDRDGVSAATSWTVEPAIELPVTLTFNPNGNEGAYGTIWAPVALKLPEGVVAYAGSVTEGVLVLTALEGKVIPENTGVVLHDANATGTYVAKLAITNEVGDAPADNNFVGWAVTRANPNTTDGDYYSLGIKSNRMAFYRYVGTNLQGFRARIERTTETPKALTMRFNNATGIEEVTSAFQNGAVYDLSGRRVKTATKGLYIVNGKKVIIK